ncbi:Predicted carbamoyl transferase, NodU family [Saccharopolyspora shandongensis]|uniref:Predicted carbamoyl transferase, NodU family n=1 Tax=Saccharopolyspora shandongensis TaxID=418495 RepID=A0A1H3BBY9_9PSEU|nr:carbamoyltransferase C-terminal domain-containing protein [Saccharopolyspora shandongensis]SDX39426.1 Predicted carbamoyl transferase, NodU family [Saccharopolyspora shandongensis]
MTNGTMGGYVVSTYLSPPGLLAFSAHRHDQNVALWRVDDTRITLVRYWEVERLSGLKHHELPLYDRPEACGRLIDELIGREGLTRADLTEIWGTPGLEITTALPEFDCKGLPVHNLAHVFSGLFMDARAFRSAPIIALAMDGGPDFALEDDVAGDTWYAGAVAHEGNVELTPVESPGLLWHASQRLFGMEPGTLMALAGASPAFVDYDLDVLLGERYWGGHSLMDKCMGLVGDIIEAATAAIRSGIESAEHPFTRDDLIASAVMKIVQAASIAIAKRNVDMLLERSGVDPTEAFLSLSGGFALNCPTNSRLVSAYGFRGLLAPPCANDSGQALGIGLLGFFARGDLSDREVDVRLPYAGEDRLRTSAAKQRWDSRILGVQDFDEEVFVADIQRHPVAWVDGAAEIGPRALGHRSLLGDPRRMETKRVLNRVKQRQWWRPVAPIVLEDHVADWFVDGRPSPFMLETFLIAPEYQTLVPAIAHIDGSARIQTLSAADEPFLAGALQAFHRESGVPIICNTSLNDRGEPIVNEAGEAVNFCVRKGIAVAYIERRRYLLDVSQPDLLPDEPQQRPLAQLYADQEKHPAVLFGPDAAPEVLYLLYFWPSLRRLAGKPNGEAKLKAAAQLIAKKDGQFWTRVDGFASYWQSLLEGKITHGQIDTL